MVAGCAERLADRLIVQKEKMFVCKSTEIDVTCMPMHTPTHCCQLVESQCMCDCWKTSWRQLQLLVLWLLALILLARGSCSSSYDDGRLQTAECMSASGRIKCAEVMYSQSHLLCWSCQPITRIPAEMNIAARQPQWI